ncbi:uncharacterized protein WCC33_003087 [Rhinophrynus dorsalis]
MKVVKIPNIFIMDPVTILLSIVVGVFLIKVLYGEKRNVYTNFPPGPKPLPIIGNLHIMDLEKPYKTFMELSKKFGSIFSFQLGTEKIVVLCGYETVKDALVNHAEEFSNRANIQIFDIATNGHGVLFSSGENWKAMRRFTLSTLRDFGMGKKSTENKINEECDNLVQKFKSYKGEPFENTMIMNSAVANIIVSILLGHRFDYEDPTLLKLIHLINENVRLLGSRMVMLYNTYPSVMRWLPGGYKTVLGNMEEMHKFIKETFTKRKEQLDRNDQRDLIDTFLVKQQEEKPNPGLYFTNDNLTALVTDLFAAGMETTSTTLRWGFLLMMKYPQIQKNVQFEIEKVIGSAQPKTEHRKQMPYTDAVIHEIQRYANIVPGNLPHATTQDVTFRGYFIPKGTQVIPLLTSVLQDKSHFERPNEFYPQHFLDSEGNFVKKEAFIPFSAGRRSCAGENLAKMELFLFFTRLLQNFTFQSPPGAEINLNPATGLTSLPVTHEICAVPQTDVHLSKQQADDDNQRVFDVPGRTTTAAKQLMTIRQGARTVADYSIEFRTLAAEVGWNNEALVAEFSQGLCDAIKDETTARELPGDLEELISVTILIDTRIHERFYQNILIMDPVTILLSIVVGFFLIIVLKGDKRNVYKNFPPGPKPLPVIGNLHIINRIKPQKTFMELYKKFGSVFSIQLGTENIVVLCGYETVKDALVNHAEEFSERASIPIFEMVAKGYGIGFSHGENWKVMRRFTLSTLRDFGMGRKSIENKINEECDYLVQKFKSYKGKPFENNIIMNSAVANIIVSITLGHRFEYEDSTLLKIVNKINKMVRLQGSRMVKLYNMYPSVTRWLPGSHNTIIGNAEEIQKFVKETFTKRKKQLDINDQRDLIDAFLVKQQEEKPHPGLYFHDNNLAVLVFSLLTAGMETTSTTLRWGFLLMMKYPEIQKNVQNEIEKVIGSAQPQAEHRKQMPYTDAVIHEIQRFADIVPLNLPHATTQDVTFRGYFIPKGTQVIPLLTSVLKDKAHFERPDEFYPQHFLDSEGNFIKKEAFIPFSAGRRMCVGETLAKMELFLFFTRLLQSFTFQLPPGAELHLNFETGLTSMPLFHEICAVPRT